jgi:hypothetical protein
MKEQDLFEYLKLNKFVDLVKSEGTFDSFDCLSYKYNLYIELKCRYKHYPDLLIEKSKYDRLVTEATARGMQPWYINSTPEGRWSFDLIDVPEPSWHSRPMPATTEFANTKKILKVVGFLDLSVGKPI